MIKQILILITLELLLTSCFTYNIREFKKFNQPGIQNHLIKKDGYYFYEQDIYRYIDYVPYGTGTIPTDSILTKTITGIFFYNNSRVYVMQSYYDGLKYNQKNSLKIAQQKLETQINIINKWNLNKNDNLRKNSTTLGKYSVDNDTITIQDFRNSTSYRFLFELKGKINQDNSFTLFQIKKHQMPLFFFFKKKPIISKLNKNYKFEHYKK